jgi:hypothetical protein
MRRHGLFCLRWHFCARLERQPQGRLFSQLTRRAENKEKRANNRAGAPGVTSIVNFFSTNEHKKWRGNSSGLLFNTHLRLQALNFVSKVSALPIPFDTQDLKA